MSWRQPPEGLIFWWQLFHKKYLHGLKFFEFLIWKMLFAFLQKNIVNVVIRMEEWFCKIFMYFYAHSARSGPKSMIPDIEGFSNLLFWKNDAKLTRVCRYPVSSIFSLMVCRPGGGHSSRRWGLMSASIMWMSFNWNYSAGTQLIEVTMRWILTVDLSGSCRGQ